MELLTLITEGRWTQLLERLALGWSEHTSYRNEVKSWYNGNLPLHFACRHSDVPVHVIEELIGAYPKAIKEKTKGTFRLPLHCAVSLDEISTPNIDIIELLLEKYPEAVIVKDRCDRTPVHDYLLHSPSHSLKIVKMLVEAHPEAAKSSDNEYWYPLHFSVLRCNHDIIKYLIDQYSEALYHKEKNYNMTPIDIAALYRKRVLWKSICKEQCKQLDHTSHYRNNSLQPNKKCEALSVIDNVSSCQSISSVSMSYQRDYTSHKIDKN